MSLPAHPETGALYLVALAATHRPATLTPDLNRQGPCGRRSPQPGDHGLHRRRRNLQDIRRTLGTAEPGKLPC